MSVYIVFDRTPDGGYKDITVFNNRAAADFVREHYSRDGVQEFSVYSRDSTQEDARPDYSPRLKDGADDAHWHPPSCTS